MRLLPLPGVFQPISDSRLLAECMLCERVRGRSVLDLCTGSGYLAITAALHGAEPAVAVDVARRSLLSVALNARLNAVRVHGRRGDLFVPVAGRRFDLIIANPPYVPSPDRLPVSGPRRAWDAGPSGRVFIDRILAAAPRHLEPGGVLLLVHSSVCGERHTIDVLRQHGLMVDVAARQRGSLGPLMRARAPWLRDLGLLHGEHEDVVVIRARAGREAEPAATSARPASGAPAPLAR